MIIFVSCLCKCSHTGSSASRAIYLYVFFRARHELKDSAVEMAESDLDQFLATVSAVTGWQNLDDEDWIAEQFHAAGGDLNAAINRVLDAIFIVDMALQFFVVYQSTHGSASGDSAWVTERKRIARHYLLGWFPLDLVSVLPSKSIRVACPSPLTLT